MKKETKEDLSVMLNVFSWVIAIICFAFGVGISFIHEDLTQMQLLIKFWHVWLGMIILVFVPHLISYRIKVDDE